MESAGMSNQSSDDEPLSRRGKMSSKRLDSDEEPLFKRGRRARRSSVASSDTSSVTSEWSFKSIDNNDEKRWDRFCWKCHRKCKNELQCLGCDLSFHNNCVPDVNRGKVGWRCRECQAGSEWSTDNLGQYVIYVVERLMAAHGPIPEPKNYTESQILHNPVTFAQICRKSQNKQYASSHDFLLDMKWLQHNCEILFKNCFKMEKKQFSPAKDLSTKWLQDCIGEIGMLRDCVDCYINLPFPEKFTLVCRKPHPILWVQFGVYPYWPTKFKKIVTKNGKETLKPIEVVFFDDEHETAEVQYKDCYLYSKEDPNEYLTDQFKNKIQAARKEAEAYIRNVEKKFGPFNYAPLKKIPEHGQIDMLHLDQMIPGYRNATLRPVQTKSETSEDEKSQENMDVDIDFINSSLKSVDGLLEPPTEKKESPEKQDSDMQQIQLPPDFMERFLMCREWCKEITEENDAQRLEIDQLRLEIAALKDQNQAQQEKHASEVEELKKEIDALKLQSNKHQETFL